MLAERQRSPAGPWAGSQTLVDIRALIFQTYPTMLCYAGMVQPVQQTRHIYPQPSLLLTFIRYCFSLG